MVLKSSNTEKSTFKDIREEINEENKNNVLIKCLNCNKYKKKTNEKDSKEINDNLKEIYEHVRLTKINKDNLGKNIITTGIVENCELENDTIHFNLRIRQKRLRCFYTIDLDNCETFNELADLENEIEELEEKINSNIDDLTNKIFRLKNNKNMPSNKEFRNITLDSISLSFKKSLNKSLLENFEKKIEQELETTANTIIESIKQSKIIEIAGKVLYNNEKKLDRCKFEFKVNFIRIPEENKRNWRFY